MVQGIASLEGSWALVLGASSGFGEAVSLTLARQSKMNIFGVHLDRSPELLENVSSMKEKIESYGCKAIS